jgi:ribosomal protein S18 acetylase RimI-like enzyme
MPGTTLRLLTKDEFDLYRDIRLHCLKKFPDHFSTTYEEEAGSSKLKFSHIFSENESNDFIFGAYVNNNLIGICGFKQETKMKTRHLGEITQMYVKPEYNGKKIGLKLLTSTLEHAFLNPFIELVRLTVIVSNERAISLYKKVGFVQYGLLEKRYKNDNIYWTEIFMILSRFKYRESSCFLNSRLLIKSK